MPALKRPFTGHRGNSCTLALLSAMGFAMGAAIVNINSRARRSTRCDREDKMITTASSKRSLVKAVTYRIIIVCLDFLAIYLLTGQVRMAVGFMIVSNVYTTLVA
jgi:Cu/Ag efflux pump CusA